MHLQFYGAAGEVTGSCHILCVAGRTVLLAIVDGRVRIHGEYMRIPA